LSPYFLPAIEKAATISTHYELSRAQSAAAALVTFAAISRDTDC
jgi:hypothetical protein